MKAQRGAFTLLEVCRPEPEFRSQVLSLGDHMEVESHEASHPGMFRFPARVIQGVGTFQRKPMQDEQRDGDPLIAHLQSISDGTWKLPRSGDCLGQRTPTGNADSQGLLAGRKCWHCLWGVRLWVLHASKKELAQSDLDFLRILLSQPAQTAVPSPVWDVTHSGPFPPSARLMAPHALQGGSQDQCHDKSFDDCL